MAVVIMEQFLNGVLVLLLVLIYILPAMFQSANRFFSRIGFLVYNLVRVMSLSSICMGYMVSFPSNSAI